MKCPQCHFKNPSDVQFCQKCLINLYGKEYKKTGMTEWERMKLGFYRNEKKWIENIQSRKVIKDSTGSHTILVDSKGNKKGEMPCI